MKPQSPSSSSPFEKKKSTTSEKKKKKIHNIHNGQNTSVSFFLFSIWNKVHDIWKKKKIHNNHSRRNIENKRSKHWTNVLATNSQTSIPSGEPTNLDGETHKPKLRLNPQTCDSLGEGRFPLFFSFLFVQTRNSSIYWSSTGNRFQQTRLPLEIILPYSIYYSELESKRLEMLVS